MPAPIVFFSTGTGIPLQISTQKRGSRTGISVEFLSIAKTPKPQVHPLES